jgi:hypothetical protein
MSLWNELNDRGTKYTEWLSAIDIDKWTLLWDGGRRCGQMTTNLVECINSTLKVARFLPITALVQTTYWRCTELFSNKIEQLSAEKAAGNGVPQRIREEIQKRSLTNGHWGVVISSRADQQFVVIDYAKNEQFKVSLLERFCDCGDFQVDRYPCEHALPCIAKLNVRWIQYVDEVYTLHKICQVWARPFTPIGHRRTWPVFNDYTLCANIEMERKAKGRPKSNRFPNEMDGFGTRRRKRCALCRDLGHTSSHCPNRRGL